ncbi:MAG: DUF2934 domain-containing protein [Deltaproteobacteria bacterium]|nr:DUF2934 domain-containing protein [Deltaproteobacteria bacterium]
MAKQRNSRSKSKPPAAAVVAPIAPAPTARAAIVEDVAVTTVAATNVAAPALVKAAPGHDEIARRAYELWLHGGGQMGTHLDDWLRAERELITA